MFTISVPNRKRINVAIAFVLLWIFDMLIYLLFTKFVRVTAQNTNTMLFFSLLLFVLLISFFMVKIDWLKDIETGKEIHILNVSNVLSSLRFTLIPMLILMFDITMKSNTIYQQMDTFRVKLTIFIFAGLICFTDAFDGYFARKLHEVTKLGQILDPLGDFLMITCFTLLVFSHGMMQWWFFALVMIRIPGLIILMLLYPLLKIKFKILSSFLGKLTIAYLLAILGYSVFGLFFNENANSLHPLYTTSLLIFQIIGAGIMVISFIEKGIIFYKYWKA